MNEEYCPAKEEVDSILFSDGYLKVMKDIGFSREFRLSEQVRKQRECIKLLALQLDELRNELIRLKSSGKTLEKIA
jgi:hypothetical protein